MTSTIAFQEASRRRRPLHVETLETRFPLDASGPDEFYQSVTENASDASNVSLFNELSTLTAGVDGGIQVRLLEPIESFKAPEFTVTGFDDAANSDVDLVALADKRGPAKVARTLYNDRTPEPTPEEKAAFAERNRGTGRPEKRDRRLLIRLRGR